MKHVVRKKGPGGGGRFAQVAPAFGRYDAEVEAITPGAFTLLWLVRGALERAMGVE